MEENTQIAGFERAGLCMGIQMNRLQLFTDEELEENFRILEDVHLKSLACAQEFENRYKCEEDGWSCHEEAMESFDLWEGAEEDRKDLEIVRQEILRRSSLTSSEAAQERKLQPRNMTQKNLMKERRRLSDIVERSSKYYFDLENSFAKCSAAACLQIDPIEQFLLDQTSKECYLADMSLSVFYRENKRRKKLSAHQRIAEERERRSA